MNDATMIERAAGREADDVWPAGSPSGSRARQALQRVRAFGRDGRGGASVELALGALVFVTVAALCFDLYTWIRADTASARLAVAMADYVSRDAEPNGDDATDLGRFLHAHELGVPANVVYMLTAFRQPPAAAHGDPLPAVDVLWVDDTIRIGDATVNEELAGDCTRYRDADGKPKLPADFAMAAGEVFIIAEVCARLVREGSITGRFVAGDFYHHHALPARDPEQPPVAPVHTEAGGDGRSVSSRDVRLVGRSA